MIACNEHCRRVTRADGREVCSCSEAWREHCEAADILALSSVADRRTRLARVEVYRGKAAADRLRALMLAMHKPDKR